MGRHVAIKVLHRPGGIGPDALRRGQAEAQILNRLRHPNIVEVIDAGTTDDGLLYIIMEHLEGRTLREVLNEHGALGVDEALGVAGEIAEGLQAAHQTGAIHRDLKPENVFVTQAGVIKILDFGIAKVADAAAWTTDKDVAHGTVLYMSPEQIQITKLTPRSDIYALGVVMFESLAGRHPILMQLDPEHANVWEIARTVLTREPPMLHDLDSRITRDVAALVNRAMAKQPEQRFASMDEVARAVRACREHWLAHAKTHGIPSGERILRQRSPSVHGHVPVAIPRTPPAGITRTAAPVTTRTAPNVLPQRGRSQVGQVVVWGCLLGTAVGSSWAWLRWQRPGREGGERVAASPAAPAPSAHASQAQTQPSVTSEPTAESPRPAALSSARTAVPSAEPSPSVPPEPTTLRTPPARVGRSAVKGARPVATSREAPTATAAPSTPSEPSHKSEDRVDLRLKRLEQTLGPTDSGDHR
jgi:serine/threonine-protein kinase